MKANLVVVATLAALAGCTAVSPRPPEVGTGVSPSTSASGAVAFESTARPAPKEYWKLDEKPAEEPSNEASADAPATQP